jgi:NTP pyrophosphatase (non-canonical NTP hydrolase)
MAEDLFARAMAAYDDKGRHSEGISAVIELVQGEGRGATLADVMELKEAAHVIMARCRENGAGGTEQAQIMALAEEVGEFIGAMRRWNGLARRRGSEAEAKAELADVIISAYAMAEVMDWDVDEITQAKLGKIMSRGWKEPESVK